MIYCKTSLTDQISPCGASAPGWAGIAWNCSGQPLYVCFEVSSASTGQHKTVERTTRYKKKHLENRPAPLGAMPLPVKSKSATAWNQTKTEELLQECADDTVWRKPPHHTQSADSDSDSDSALGGTTSSSEEGDSACAVSPDVPILINPNDPLSTPDHLLLSRANSQTQYDQQRLLDSLASFRDTLVANHAASLSMLDQELEKVKHSMAMVAATASTSLLVPGKSTSKSSAGREVRVKLPGALGTSDDFSGTEFVRKSAVWALGKCGDVFLPSGFFKGFIAFRRASEAEALSARFQKQTRTGDRPIFACTTCLTAGSPQLFISVALAAASCTDSDIGKVCILLIFTYIYNVFILPWIFQGRTLKLPEIFCWTFCHLMNMSQNEELSRCNSM